MAQKRKGSLKIILTSEGGSGHIAAANVLEERFKLLGDKVDVINMAKERWFSGFLGIELMVVDIWNFSQKHGCTFILKFLSFLERFNNVMTFSIKNNILNYIDKYIDDYDEIEIHNTFPISLFAIVDAVANYNRTKNKSVKVKYFHHLTDLPSEYAENLKLEFSYLNPDSLKDSEFKLVTVPPVLSEDENLSIINSLNKNEIYINKIRELFPNLFKDDIPKESYSSRVEFTSGPVRKEFLKYKDNPASREKLLSISFANKNEYSKLKSLLGNDHLLSKLNASSNEASINLVSQSKNAEVISIMLGSQADIEGSLTVVSSEYELHKESNNSNPKYVFLFCGPNNENYPNCLYKKAISFAEKHNNDSFKLIPLTKQGPQTIAQLYSTADQLCIRPGGLSAMEARMTAKGKVMVYTVVDYLVNLANKLMLKTNDELINQYSMEDQKERLSELVHWEAGNAIFLEQNLINFDLDASNVSCANRFSYYNMRKVSNTITEKLLPLMQSGKYDEVFAVIKKDNKLRASLPQFGGKVKKIAILNSILNNLSNIQNKYIDISKQDIINESCKDTILSLIEKIETQKIKLINNPLNEDNAQLINECYQSILDTSTHVYNSIKGYINYKNQDIINEITSIILSIIAQIPVINYLVKDSLEAKFHSMSCELNQVNENVKRLLSKRQSF